jgi:hypothetical protein
MREIGEASRRDSCCFCPRGFVLIRLNLPALAHPQESCTPPARAALLSPIQQKQLVPVKKERLASAAQAASNVLSPHQQKEGT